MRPKSSSIISFHTVLIFIALVLTCSPLLLAQQRPISNGDRETVRQMLREIMREMRKNYYDPNFHGVDLDERAASAEKKIQQAQTHGQAFRAIAAALEPLNDSHTRFLPPPRAYRVDRGWQIGMIGDRCFVTAVKPGSDAAAKGLKPGDQILSYEGIAPTRNTLWKLEYLFHVLEPRSASQLLVVSPGGKPRQIDINFKVQAEKLVINALGPDVWNLVREEENDLKDNSPRWVEFGDRLLIYKLPRFSLQDTQIDSILSRARNHKAFILDLRGNGGGLESNLARLLGGLFDHEIKIGENIGRKPEKPLMTKSRGSGFTGKLIVLIDSRSASASEIFARVVQLQNRGTVIGDVSSGSVMAARIYPFSIGFETRIFYALELTVLDLIMIDGKSLEHSGVTPDELLLPSAEDLAAGRDPVLAQAAEMAGVAITPEKAGQLFPVVWKHP